MNRVVIPFPGLSKASVAPALHNLRAGEGSVLTIKHTHPAFTEEERLEQLKGIKKLCAQILHPEETEERAG